MSGVSSCVRPHAPFSGLLTDNRSRAARIRSPPSQPSGTSPASSKGGIVRDASSPARAAVVSGTLWGVSSDDSPAEKVDVLLLRPSGLELSFR
eukprot:4065564-Prymnesium_polylepis.1